MRTIKKLSIFLSFALSLSILFQNCVTLAYTVYMHDLTKLYDGTPAFSASLCDGNRKDCIKLEGDLGDFSIRRERFGRYIVEKSPGKPVAQLVENGASDYTIKLSNRPEGGWDEWNAKRPDGCSYWKLTPQGRPDPYKRKIYINKIRGTYTWSTEVNSIIAGDSVTHKIATINFDSDIYGEVEDLINFSTFAAIYSKMCRPKYWI